MEFILGCNYWASNAGTEMWNQWDEKAVREDFEILSSHGVKYLRVFPNWRDFQPVIPYYGCEGRHKGYLLDGDKMPQNPYYLAEAMLDKFDRFCELAEEYNLKFIVGLITGWMSGRLFLPPVLYGKNLYSDATALMLEQKFIKGFVKWFKDKACIYAWDLGNECNCLSETESRDQADSWVMTIANAIRANDPTRPIVSGMHGLDTGKMWNVFDQGESLDILTTHPYPYWVAHCSEAKATSVQTLMHATCQTKYYAELGGKPCLVEELGTMGPMICGDEEAAGFLKVNLFSNWANGSPGVMWWCANEQIDLMFAPYRDQPCETELGMIDKYRNPKPVLKEMKSFAQWLKESDLTLPKAEVDAVCLMSEISNGVNWGRAYSSYVLARQAGLNVSYAYANREIPEAKYYILPSITSSFVSLDAYKELRKRVFNGAILYISSASGIIPEFDDFTGLEVRNTETKVVRGKFELGDKTLTYQKTRNYFLSVKGAEVLAEDETGNPLFTRFQYGKGVVYYLNFPLEDNVIGVSDAYEGNQHEVYKYVFADVLEKHAVFCENQYIGVTQHVDGSKVYAVLINYSEFRQELKVQIGTGYKVAKLHRGELEYINPFEAVIVELESIS